MGVQVASVESMGQYDICTYMCVESCVLSRPRFRAGFCLVEVRRGEGSTYVCRSRGCGLLSQVVAMNTIL